MPFFSRTILPAPLKAIQIIMHSLYGIAARNTKMSTL